jgi:hypothetical protein
MQLMLNAMLYYGMDICHCKLEQVNLSWALGGKSLLTKFKPMHNLNGKQS